MLQLYSLAMALAVGCLLLPHRCFRRLVQRDGPETLRQLLGHPPSDLIPPPEVVMHAVSAGEMAAAGAIIRQLHSLRPDTRLLLTTGTSAGMGVGQSLQRELPGISAVVLLPWDRSGALRRWLGQLSPKAMVVVETELWPNLFNECRRLEIALAVVNGRIYPRDVGRYRLIHSFMQRVLDCTDWIGVQDQVERQRFLAIGADPQRLRILGNSKFDSPARPGIRPHRFPDPHGRPAPIIMAASTHDPEEYWLLDLLPRLHGEFPGLRLILAPRHCERGATLAKAAVRGGWRTCRFSLGHWQDRIWDVLVLDRMGQLPAFFAGADVVVMGGSLVDRGGHNFLEPAQFARPIVVGPYLQHFHTTAERFLACGALWRVQDRTGLETGLFALLRDPVKAKDLGRKAQGCAVAEGRRCGDYGLAIAQLLTGRSSREKSR